MMPEELIPTVFGQAIADGMLHASQPTPAEDSQDHPGKLDDSALNEAFYWATRPW
jgi:hypothetical protein